MFRDVVLARYPVPEPLEGLVDWCWSVRWNLADGTEFAQDVASQPGVNLSVGNAPLPGTAPPPGPLDVRWVLNGVSTGVTRRVLRGRGWNVAAKTATGGFGAWVDDVGAITDRVFDGAAPFAEIGVLERLDRELPRRAAERGPSVDASTVGVSGDENEPGRMRMAGPRDHDRGVVAAPDHAGEDGSTETDAGRPTWIEVGSADSAPANADEAAALAQTAAEIAAELVRLLEQRPPARVDEAREISRIARFAETDRAVRRVDDLARAAGVSSRTLQRRFATCAGVSPSWVIRRFRLLEAAELVCEGAQVDWADVAASLGYADQAHLVRDFRATLGDSPAAYARAQRTERERDGGAR